MKMVLEPSAREVERLRQNGWVVNAIKCPQGHVIAVVRTADPYHTDVEVYAICPNCGAEVYA